ncbi:nuclear transport factor 2 family protein [Pseudonocardia sp. CA-107938]|uniref:nuclear transport factor 2 family protein n=1 Tax=Pseudonocardia sp. CA-107938 TaxID=3240021 RepID=UPI003D8EA006
MIVDEYLARLDGPEPLSGLELVEPDIEFLIALPGREVAGSGRAELGAYIAGRPAVGRRHHLVRRGNDGDLEMVYGYISEGDGHGTGSFVSVGLVSPERRLARYQSFFHPTFGMYPLPGGAA